MAFKKIQKKIIDFLFPRLCIGCGLVNQEYLCDYCASYLVNSHEECFYTRKPSKDWRTLIEIGKDSPIFSAYYAFEYNEIIHRLLSSIKYNGEFDKTNLIIKLIKKSKVYAFLQNDISVVTYMPMYKAKELSRGFNLAKLIAEGLFDGKRIVTLVKKIKQTIPQMELDRKERLENQKDVFEIAENIENSEPFRKILIVDDIATTGTTLNECAKVIQERYPNSEINVLFFARGKNE